MGFTAVFGTLRLGGLCARLPHHPNTANFLRNFALKTYRKQRTKSVYGDPLKHFAVSIEKLVSCYIYRRTPSLTLVNEAIENLKYGCIQNEIEDVINGLKMLKIYAKLLLPFDFDLPNDVTTLIMSSQSL